MNRCRQLDFSDDDRNQARRCGVPAPQTRPCRFGFDEGCDLGTYCPSCPERPVPYQRSKPRRRPFGLGEVAKIAAVVLAALVLGHIATKAFAQINHDRLHASERAPW